MDDNGELNKKGEPRQPGKDIAELGAEAAGSYYGGEIERRNDERVKVNPGQATGQRTGYKMAGISWKGKNRAPLPHECLRNRGLIDNAIGPSNSGNDMQQETTNNGVPTNTNNDTSTIDDSVRNQKTDDNNSNSSSEKNGKGILRGLLSKNPIMKLLLIGGGSSFLSLVMFIVILIAPLMVLGIIDIDDLESDLGYTDIKGPTYESSTNTYLWPIGGSEEEDGFATGEPVAVNYISKDTGIVINANNTNVGEANIIAVRSGEVIYPVEDTQKQYEDSNEPNDDGSGYGNYIKIKHSDGSYTLYAHLAKDSIRVSTGDVVSEGQIIGKMGSSGNASETSLYFEVRIGSDAKDSAVNPLDYVEPENPRPKGYGNSDAFSITSTILSKQEFINRMNDYCSRSNNTNFCNNFSNNAELVYNVSIKNNVNPELVVVTAGTEENWKNSCGNHNYWGINVTNTGGGCGTSYNSLADGIAGYGKLLNSYTNTHKESINYRYQQRKNAGCDPSGHGEAGTLIGMQSIYSWIGDYRYNPGTWSLGGCVYLNIIYGEGYCSNRPTCFDKNNCPTNSATTVCEQNDYTAFQVKQKIDMRYDIFGL